MNNIVDELIRIGNKYSCDTISYLKIPNHIDNEKLQIGFQNAINHFSKSKMLYRNQTWVKQELINEVKIENIQNIHSTIVEWLNIPIDIANEPLIQEKIFTCDKKRYLACKLNHVLADGISLINFFNAQLNSHFTSEMIEFKQFPPKKNTPYKSFLPSQIFKERNKPSGYRDYIYFQGAKKSNNELIAALFKTLKELGIKRRSVWLPVNIREKGIEGFGNGISRVRIYDNPKGSIKRQKVECMKNGELIGIPKIQKLSLLKKALIKCYLNRPLIDYCSILLSHFDEAKAGVNILSEFDEIYGILNLHHRYSLAMYVHGTNVNHYTIIYDKGLLSPIAVERFKNVFLQSLA